MQQSDSPNFTEIILRLEVELIAKNEDSMSLVLTTVDDMLKYCSKGGLRERRVPAHKIEHWYTRLAAAITSVITNPATLITHKLLHEICRRKQAFVYIFNASGYRDMRHLPGLMSQKTEEGNLSIKRDRAAVLLAFLGLDDVTDTLMQTALQQPAPVLFELMMGWLNQRAVLTDQGEKNRTQLLLSGNLIVDHPITDKDIPHMVNAWMYCSYASTPDKHEIKKTFNVMFRSLLHRANITPPRPVLRKPKRPKLLVIHERFLEMHAMYRCYAAYVRGLREHFELHALAEEMWIDEASEELFDTITKIKSDRKNLKGIVDTVLNIAPDIIWYPSLGMSHWTVMLANLRLAPMQVMTHGHPATTHSDCIDYLYLTSYIGDPTMCHSEKVLLGDAKTIAFDGHVHLAASLPELAEASEREVRVAVNSKVMKLSNRLIAICKAINKQAKYPVRFIFFPGERHLYFDGVANAIAREIPNSDTRPYMNYQNFLKEISMCDLALAAFPFGNTNGTVDTCLLGLPTVAHFGPETPAQSDRLVMRTAGYPDWCICETDEQYLTAALNLINDFELRNRLKTDANRTKIRDQLLGQPQSLVYQGFAEQLIAAYQSL